MRWERARYLSLVMGKCILTKKEKCALAVGIAFAYPCCGNGMKAHPGALSQRAKGVEGQRWL